MRGKDGAVVAAGVELLEDVVARPTAFKLASAVAVAMDPEIRVHVRTGEDTIEFVSRDVDVLLEWLAGAGPDCIGLSPGRADRGPWTSSWTP